MKILFVWPNKDSFGYKPIGLSILSAIAKNIGFECRLFDTSEIDFGYINNTQAGETVIMFKPVDFTPYNTNKKKIDLNEFFTKTFNEYQPDILCFSVLSDEYQIANQITKRARELNSKIPIIWGGKYPTLNPERVLLEFGADYACIGEGIDAFPELLYAIKENEDSTNIKNIWAKLDKIIIKNDIRELHKNLDDLPYVDWEIFDERHHFKPYDGNIYIGGDHMSNWGCPNHCTYCINHFYHSLYDKYYVRRYSTKRIIAELKHLKRIYKLELLKFHDEDFLARPIRNLLEFGEEYRKEVNVPFVIMTNAKFVSEEKVKILRNMNCVSVSIGIETGDSRLRKQILKRTDNREDIIEAFKTFKKYGIRTSSFNMFGIPCETRETYWETIKLNREADVQYPNTVFFYPFEGTELREFAIKEGLFDPEGEDKDVVYQQDRPFLHLKNLTARELIEMRNVFLLYIKLPEIYKKYIKRSEIQDDIGKKLRCKLIEIYEKTVWANDGWFKDDSYEDEYIETLGNIISEEIN